jgi:membrane-bound serine protease (ClpP class)
MNLINPNRRKSSRGLVGLSFLGLFLVACHPSSLIAQEQESLPNPFEMLPSASLQENNAEEQVAAEPLREQAQGESLVIGEQESAAEIDGENMDDAPEEANTPIVNPGDGVDEIEDELERQMEVDGILEGKFQRAVLIEISGPIFERFRWFINQRLDRAEAAGADLVIIKLTTPGGDLDASLEIARRLRDLDWAKTIVWIPEESISGGAIVSFGCDRIYMKEGALIGDAGPIQMGMGFQFEHAEEKIVSYLAEAIRDLAESKGRPGALAEAMVDRNLAVYSATDKTTGELVYLTQNQCDDEDFIANYEVGPAVPEAGQNRFLTLAAERAVELSVAEKVFQDETAFLAALQIDQLERTSMNWVDKLVFTLNRPWITALLLIAGFIGIYIEFAAPGISVAGLLSMFAFGIFFWSHFLGGTSGWLEVVLFILGITCLICEIFVLPGFGIFGITGLGLVVLSLVMASQSFVIPEGANQWGQFQTNLLTVLGCVLGVLVLLFVQVFLLDSIPGLNRFRLAAPEVGGANLGEVTGLTGLTGGLQRAKPQVQIGMQGRAESDLRPSGKVMIDGQLLDVVTEGDYVEAQTPVEVVRVEGMSVTVRRLEA